MIREELPLVDQPKVTLHDDLDPPPFTIQLPPLLVNPSSGGGVLASLNGGRCNHMGGGDEASLANATGNSGFAIITTENGQECENGAVPLQLALGMREPTN